MYSIPNKVWQFVRLCPFSRARWWAKKDSLCVKNIENADKPKSAIAMLPPRPCRVSGNVPHTAFSSSSREGSSSILILNHFLLRLRILKTHFPSKNYAATTICPYPRHFLQLIAATRLFKLHPDAQASFRIAGPLFRRGERAIWRIAY